MGRRRLCHGDVLGYRRSVLLSAGHARNHARVALALSLLIRGIAGGYDSPASYPDAQQAVAANVTAAEAKLQDKAKDIRLFPVVTGSVTYRF